MRELEFDFRAMTLYALVFGFVASLYVRWRLARLVASDSSLAPHRGRVQRWVDLVLGECVIFHAVMGYVFGCSDPTVLMSRSFGEPCVLVSVLAHLGLSGQILWWAWATDGPQVLVTFHKLFSGLPSNPGGVKWYVSLAAGGSVVMRAVIIVLIPQQAWGQG